MVNSAINHALINHSNVLSNTVYNAAVQSFKEGQAPPLYAGLAYHQPGLASVSAPSAPSAVVGTKVTSPLVSASLPNVQSTLVRSDPVLSGGRLQLYTDLSVSAMSWLVSQNSQISANWWGYGMPPELSAISSGLPQLFDAARKAPMTATIPVSPMTQVPKYATSTTTQPISGGFQMPLFQAPSASSSASLLPMQ